MSNLTIHKPPPLVTGVVPAHIYGKLGFNLPWNDVLMPLAPNYTAIQNAVHTCVRAGCDTVWVIVNDDTLPLVKRVVGNAWKDYYPGHINRDKNDYRLIPIYYAPISTWDRDERDSHGWAMLHGCYISRRVADRVSKWIRPKRFFIVSPFGVYPIPKMLRIELRANEHNVLLSYEGESVKEGSYLAFSVGWDEVYRLRRRVHYNSTLSIDWFHNLLPKEERNSARFFELETIFDDMNTENHVLLEVDEYYSIDTWDGYVNCLANEQFIKRPADDVLKYREFRGIDSYAEEED